MRLIYHHETIIPHGRDSILMPILKWHNDFLRKGVDTLKESDSLNIWTSNEYWISNKIDSTKAIVPILEKTDKILYEKPIYKVNFPFHPSFYPIRNKENHSSIACRNGETIHFSFIGNACNNRIKMGQVYNLFTDSVLTVLKSQYGERVTLEQKFTAQNVGIRYDLLLDGQKFCGIDNILYKNKFIIMSAIQNKWNEEIKRNIYYLMEDDPHWKYSTGKNIGIIGVEIDLLQFLITVQNNLDDLYEDKNILQGE